MIVFNIAICDDEINICSQIENIILNHSSELGKKVEVEVYTSGEELCKSFYDGMYFDMIFLDIELKMLNGVEVGKKIRDEMQNETTSIVYISGKDSYAMDLFDVRPLNFLIKPLKAEKIVEVVKKAIELSKKSNYFFEFNIGKTFYKVPHKSILYFESRGKKIKIVTKDGVKEFYGKLNDVDKQIASEDFILIHKSYLVNYFYVSEYQYEYVKLFNGVILPISQHNRKYVHKKLLNRRINN